MDRSDIVKLIKVTYQNDEYGVQKATETERQVYCNVISTNATEVFEGGRNGLNPVYRFTMFRYDYDGEEIVEYEGKRYYVYRAYTSGRSRSWYTRSRGYRTGHDTIELYVEQRGGNYVGEGN